MNDPNDSMRPRTRVEQVVGIINWEALRDQKLVLLELANDPNREGTRRGDALLGLVSLMDALQDAAAEDLGEFAVFGQLADS